LVGQSFLVAGPAFVISALLGDRSTHVASVTVSNESPANMQTATLTPTDESNGSRRPILTQSSSHEIHFYLVPSSPFGRSYNLSVSSYLPQTIQVLPFWGTLVRPQHDLRPSLAVLIRPDADGLRTLADGGRLLVWIQRAGKNNLISTSSPNSASSILIGRAQPISPLIQEGWRLELTAKSLTPEMIARRIIEWRTPYCTAPNTELEPGMTLAMELQSKAGSTVAHSHVSLSDDRLTDLPLESFAEPSDQSVQSSAARTSTSR
jgi:hypothetical protein